MGTRGRTGARTHGRTGTRGLASSRSGARAAAAALLLASALPGALRAQEPDAGDILDRAVAIYGRVNTLRAEFTQVIRDPMLGTTDTSSGEFLQQRPGKFALRWQHPRGDLIVADGRVMWVFLPSSAPNQVIKTNLTGKPGESADLVADFLDQPRQRFTVAYVRADSVGNRPADVLALVPKQPGTLPYRRVLIWVDRADTLVHRVELNEGSGGVRRITLERIRTNVPIPASSFVFRPPQGVRVVDASQ